MSKKWTDEEDNLLRKNSNVIYSIDSLNELFPNRTERSISSRFYKLGLKLKKKEIELVKNSYNYNKNQSLVSNYKIKYGIILDKNLVLNTYDEIQWWEWTFKNTPNGKKLKCLPLEFNNNKSIIKIIRHVIFNVMGYSTRDEIISITIKKLSEFRIYYHHFFYKKSNYEFLNIIFPELNIKPYELPNVPLGYWKDKNNCDEYMNYVLYHIINVNELDIKIQLPQLFLDRTMYGFNGLMTCIYSYNHYESFYDWINYLHPEWDLEPKDFSEYIALDGERLCSYGEVKIYDMINSDLKLDIIPIGTNRNKYKFYNELENEKYYPDFILNYNNKSIIIEYFGLFDKNYKKNPILEKYYYKTLRKVEFYKSLNNYYFLSIYPNDINDINKLKYKLFEFLKEVS